MTAVVFSADATLYRSRGRYAGAIRGGPGRGAVVASADAVDWAACAGAAAAGAAGCAGTAGLGCWAGGIGAAAACAGPVSEAVDDLVDWIGGWFD
jgi:hypothetical protein